MATSIAGHFVFKRSCRPQWKCITDNIIKTSEGSKFIDLMYSVEAYVVG